MHEKQLETADGLSKQHKEKAEKLAVMLFPLNHKLPD